MGRIPTRLEFSAGGVVYRRDREGRPEVVLISTHGGQRWGLPKGWVEEGESPEEAAVREVHEETGIAAEVVEALDRVEYWFRWKQDTHPILVHKYVDFYLMKAAGGDLAEHDQEVEEARWFSLDQAVELATHDRERQILMEAQARLAASDPPGAESPAGF